MPKLVSTTPAKPMKKVYELDSGDFSFHFNPSDFIEKYEEVTSVKQTHIKVYYDGCWRIVPIKNASLMIEVVY